ncbi:MAG: hypothetical protein CVV47_15640 [Spirochaetae bacterium HGW-Spirochaetae-3]|jgi:8-oxo-dGTP pyrophosphatase MutT (NUDIX family)|nr:MAG: hypothetical protein CVV47_15640 [Spirochaetae bacterium HGW-Spirochaetae-3]
MVKHCHDGKTYWTFPGGAREQGETFEQAAVREVREETGITVRIIEHIFDEAYIHQGAESTSRCFFAAQVGNDPVVLGYDPEDLAKEQSARILQDIRWASLEEVRNDKQVARLLEYLAGKRRQEKRQRVVTRFWECVSNAEFEKLELHMTPHAKVYLPNTREVILGRADYILFNRSYPGRWYAEIERTCERDGLVITTAKVRSGDSSMSFYVTSYFAFEDDRISEIAEYWGENSEPPAWRRNGALTKRY